MAVTNMMHIGMTVTDIEKTVGFYCKYLGFRKAYGRRFDETFVADQPKLYRQPEGVFIDMQMIEGEDGTTIELFQFSNTEADGTAEWQKTGYHHISFKVPDLQALYETMLADGIEFFKPPSRADDFDGHWLFLKDPDGNMVELWD